MRFSLVVFFASFDEDFPHHDGISNVEDSVVGLTRYVLTTVLSKLINYHILPIR
jgi:hypothetical protein